VAVSKAVAKVLYFIKRERAGYWTLARRKETERERKTTCFETAESKAMFRKD